MSVNKNDILKGFKELGLSAGALVIVHASLRSIGPVDGGARTVLAAMLEAIGSRGTLVVPVFHDFFLKGPCQVWDREKSRSRMGMFSEFVRLRPEASRSAHPTHPIAAIGPLSGELTSFERGSAFGKNSAFMRLVERNSAIVLMGVGYNVCTLMHLPEEIKRVHYRQWTRLSGTVICDGIPKKVHVPFYRRKIGFSNCFAKCGNALEAEGKVACTLIGRGVVRRIWAADLYTHVTKSLADDSMYLAKRSSFLLVLLDLIKRTNEKFCFKDIRKVVFPQNE